MSASRLLQTDGFNQLVAGKDGYFLYNHNDMYVGRALEKYGEFSVAEMDLLRHMCRPGDIVIEVGANIGAHTVGLAKLVGSQGRVLAFEPQRLVYQTLCANVALNSLENVDCHWAALGMNEGFVTVPEFSPRQEFNFGGVSLVGAQAGQQVVCQTLNRFAGLPKLRLVKIDVEGMEAQVLRGGEQLLRKFRPVLYVENDRLDRSEALITLIAGFGYRMFWHFPPLYNPNNFFGEQENIYPGIVSGNMLCVHRDMPMQVEGLQEVTDFSDHPIRRMQPPASGQP